MMTLFALPMMTLAALATAAADPPPEAQALSRCRQVADPQVRLRCLDDAAAALDAAQANGTVVILRGQAYRAQAQAAAVAPSRHEPGLLARLLPGEEDVAPSAPVTLKLARAHTTASGRWVIVAEGGSQWRQTDEHQGLGPGQGSSLVVQRRRGRLFCRVDAGPEFSCSRDR